MFKCYKWIKTFILIVLLICLMTAPCYAAMFPQAVITTTFSKSMNNPAASNDYWLAYSCSTGAYQTYRVAGSFRSNLSSSYSTYWQFRDYYGNVMYSFTTTGTNVRTVDTSFASTPFSGFYLYVKTNNTSVVTHSVSSNSTDLLIYYGSDIAEQDDMEAALTAANTASTNAVNAYTAATTASTRALNNYNILYPLPLIFYF